MSLERFHQAQAGAWAGYATALAEIQRGAKRSHWIWYIFPQIAGLGRSSTARTYALDDLEETRAYLADPVLRARYEEISAAVAEQLARGVGVEKLMGGSIDALKLASSLTLFRAAAEELSARDPSLAPLTQCCDDILQRIASDGYGPCDFTLARLAAGPHA